MHCLMLRTEREREREQREGVLFKEQVRARTQLLLKGSCVLLELDFFQCRYTAVTPADSTSRRDALHMPQFRCRLRKRRQRHGN